ncbi:hypothetical protein GGX14DRAFT_385518 [Mycena pura]|uniref:Uncharacterized protein n=1 Tax=Mycena pura TaxID=153505 RepID=A0AAD7E3E7_9AGAR|nr:hypothetical protein GGX14DRAFT_385518 [Mycena pura]
MRFTAAPVLLSLVAVAQSALVIMQACNGVDTGSPCVNYQGTLPSACIDLSTGGQDNTVSSVTLSPFASSCTLFADVGCTGSSVKVAQTFINLADVGFDNVASSFECA